MVQFELNEKIKSLDAKMAQQTNEILLNNESYSTEIFKLKSSNDEEIKNINTLVINLK